jgi:hypothetical protein
MTISKNEKRILALDVRPRSFGYAVFEGPERLLDWGAKSFRSGVNAVQVPRAKKLEALLEEFLPSVAVLRKPGLRSKRKKFVEGVRGKADGYGIPVRFLSAREIQKAFDGQTRRGKYEIASAVAHRFRELAWILPPKRKCWQSEDYRMSIFDAVALGVAYFTRQTKPRPVEPATASDPP